jgi:hypothetical protein
MIVQNVSAAATNLTDISFTLPRTDVQAAMTTLAATIKMVADRFRRFNAAVDLDDNLANFWPVGLVDTGQDAEQGGLSGAVRPAQADPLPIADLPGDMVEQDTVAERLVELRELDHWGRPERSSEPHIVASARRVN